MFRIGRLGVVFAVVGLAATLVVALPGKAEAWWRGGFWCCGVRFGLVLPPVVVAPRPYYAPPPAYYPPPVAYYGPGRVWVPPHWEGGYWVPGHWG